MNRLDRLLAKPRASLTEDEKLELHCLMFSLDDWDETFLRACGVRPADLRDELLVLDQ
jgi:hypothetical protein